MGRGRKTIVAGVSELGTHDLSLRVALELGRRSGATVHLVHAFDLQPLEWAAPEAAPVYDHCRGRLPAELRAALEDAARPLGPEPSSVCHAVPGTAGHALAAVAADAHADLIVVGSAHAGRVRQAFLGTTAQRVLRAAHVPVLVVRRPVPTVPPRVLLTSDLSPLAASVHDRALDVAASFLGPCGALRSLAVASFGSVSPPVPAAALAQAVSGELERFLAARRPRLGRVEPAVRLGTAVAAEVFAEAAGWRADLLVVGTHARHAFEALALGGTAEACIRDAPCNVLAVPPASPPGITLEAAAPAAVMAGASA